MATTTPLRLHYWHPAVVDALGPGRRAVAWVQGCSLKCPGCMVPETWTRSGGELVDPLELAEMMLQGDIEGVTVSGGEPTEQPQAVAILLGAVKKAGKNTWLYSGYTLDELLARNDPDTDTLLSCVDVLVDGRYAGESAGVFRLRGSGNQRILHLTDVITPRSPTSGDQNRIEITLEGDGRMVVIGIPPPGFLRDLKTSLERRGLTVRSSEPWR